MSDSLRRIAIKIGSNVLTRSDGTLDVTRMSALVDQITELHHRGIEIILISSGAVAAGKNEFYTGKKLDSVDSRQLFSAVGQVQLIHRYYELFREQGICIGQVLTTKESFFTRRHYLNQRNCMSVMLENGIIPIVNENDTIAITELMFTDNDELSGLVATMMNVQALIILSNIDGIYNGSPLDSNACVIRTIAPKDDLSAYIQATKSQLGRGGMFTKIQIARKVAAEGITVFIANGKRENILIDLLTKPDDTLCSRFIPSKVSTSSIKRWIAHSEGFAKGKIYIDKLASETLCSGKAISILPIGIIRVEGQFEENDIVRIVDYRGKELGIGKTNYATAQVSKLMGLHGQKPVVHYDYLYVE